MDTALLQGDSNSLNSGRRNKNTAYSRLILAIIIFLIGVGVLVILITHFVGTRSDTLCDTDPDIHPYVPVHDDFPVTKEDLPKNIVFVGHMNCDTDALASAFGAAELFGGIAAKCVQNLNPETAYVFKYWNIEEPLPSNSPQFINHSWGLTDHSELVQIPDGVDKEKVLIVIDHHQMSDTSISFITPVYIDARPWGSASTVVTYKFFEARKSIPDLIAKLLMSAIISDTIQLRSPTTTEFDRIALEYFRKQLQMTLLEVDMYSLEMFVAKSNVTGLTDEEIVLLDFKQYTMQTPGGDVLVGWGAAETALTYSYIQKQTSFLNAMLKIKAEQNLDLIFFAPVNLMTENSTIYICGDHEKIVAEQTYGRPIIWQSGSFAIMNTTPGYVSRKHDFIPPLMKYLENHNLPNGTL